MHLVDDRHGVGGIGLFPGVARKVVSVTENLLPVSRPVGGAVVQNVGESGEKGTFTVDNISFFVTSADCGEYVPENDSISEKINPRMTQNSEG